MSSKGYSLGMIETLGYPALIAAADAASKAADVQVITYEGADAGIVTVYVIGDVASVQAAVDVGAEEAKRVGRLLHSHVIARPGESVYQMITQLLKKKTEPAAVREPEAAQTADAEEIPEAEIVLDEQDLESKPLTEIRKIARSIKNFPLSAQAINTARKEDLIQQLLQLKKERGE